MFTSQFFGDEKLFHIDYQTVSDKAPYLVDC